MKTTRTSKAKPLDDRVIAQFIRHLRPIRKRLETMILFGSRSRNDWRPDSDYDILIVVEKKDRKLKSRFYDAVMEVLLDTGKLVSLKIFSRDEFERLKRMSTPFISNILKEGIHLGFDD